MSTVVVVRKNGVACIAADSLTSYGELKLSSRYDPHSEKIQTFGDTHLSVVGSAAHTLVIESLLSKEAFFPDFSDRAAIFKTFSEVHTELKENYFLNTKDEEDTLCERYTSILYSGQQAQEALMHWVQCMRCMIAMIPQSL